MELNEDLISLLRSPKSGQPLAASSKELISADGSEHYPLVDGIPWLLPEPGNSLLDWGAKIHHLNQVFASEATQLEKQLIKSPTLIRQRREALIKGKRDFVTAVNQLIKPLGSIQLPTTAVYDSLRGKAPATQNLLSYEANLYRDW
ncbi:MAG: hypothetical protein MI867_17720, partial [Pseudomonadales bacterium]|nr:hypothetical protein [Pseudomonadales bacterium]